MERLVDHRDADAIADEDGDGLTAGSQRAEVRSPFGLCLWPEALIQCPYVEPLLIRHHQDRS